MIQEKITYQLVNEVAIYVRNLLDKKLPKEFVFHNFQHAKYVAKKTHCIGKKINLAEKDFILAEICAWFHDTGFTINPKNHEAESAKIAEAYLKKKGLNNDDIEKVKKCILATKVGTEPQDLISKTVCDADLVHMSQPDYFQRIKKMQQEWKNISADYISDKDFFKTSEIFFNKHQYHTDFGKTELNPKKQKNLELIKKRITMLEKNQLNLAEPKEKKKKKKKKKSYSRGVESMFKNTARMQINLSSIADKKSNILISVNAIIISITTTLLISQFEENPNIIFPSIILLSFSLITIIFAILSTRPNISSGKFDKEDVENNKVNLLFFGNFYDMDLEEYEWAMKEIMKNDKKLYSTLIMDQHSLGKVLAKKYKLLRIAYNVFMIGIVLSVFIFILTFVRIKLG